MSYSKRSRYSRSPSPYKQYSRSVSRSLSPWSRSHARGRLRSESVENHGNNLYVTGLSHRITNRDLKKHFASEGTVEDVHLVVDPLSRESRGFGFVTMSSVEEADHSIKYLNRSVIDGRVITVEKARRRRGRTPTPGRYLGLRTIRVHHRAPSYSHRSPSYSPRRSPTYSPYRRSLSRSPRYSSERDRSRSYSPYSRRHRSYRSRSRSPYSRQRSYSPHYSCRRARSPYYSRHRAYYRSHSYSRSPDSRNYSRRRRSYSPYDYHSPRRPSSPYYRRHCYRSISRSISTEVGRSRRSVSPTQRRSSRSYSCSISPEPRRQRESRDRYSHSSRSFSKTPSDGSVSRSVTPRSASPSS